MSFFGIEVAPGEPAYYRPDEDCPCVTLKKATLIVDGGDGEEQEGSRVLIKCRVEKGPPYVLASLIPGRVENTHLDVTFTDDVRISVSVVPGAASKGGKSSSSSGGGGGGGKASASKAAKIAKASPPPSQVRYTVHLTGNVDDSYQMVTGGGGGGGEDSEEEEGESEESEESGSETASEDEDGSDTQSKASSASWGSGDDMDVDDDDDDGMNDDDDDGGGGKTAARRRANGDDDAAVAARRLAAETGARTGRWTTPNVEDDGAMMFWEAKEDSANSEWAYHLQTSGARQHRRSSQPPAYKWTGDLRPALVSPRRRVPSVGWLAPPPDYARSGWPEAEFASPMQHKLEVKTTDQLAKMKAACSLGRAVMDAVAAAIQPGVTTDALDRICHVMTVANGAYPSPRNYMGFPKSLCTSINEVVCHGIPDARPLEDGDIINLDITVCLNGYHGDLNETYLVGKGTTRDEAKTEAAKKLMAAALECLELAIAKCRPGTRFRDLGEVIQTRGNAGGYGVVKDFCGHGIGSLFHCAPNVPHYARNKAVGVMQPGMTFTIEPMLNEGTHKCKHWPDGWTAVTADGGRSAQYEHTLAITASGVEILTARTANSRPFY